MKRTRRAVQIGVLGAVLGGVFVGGGNCERWCPFGGVEAFYTYAAEGNMICSLGASNFFILGGVLLSVLLLRRAFCGYLCPIGAISEWMHSLGCLLRLPAVRVPGRWDWLLGLLKYPTLAIILVATWSMGELVFRGFDPCYALISRHGKDISLWAYIVTGIILAGSLVVTVPFCRWLCPFAAVLNPFSRFAVGRVRRDTGSCLACGGCSRRCPMAIPVDQVKQVTEARCISCLNCVEDCPAGKGGSGALSWGFPRPVALPWAQVKLLALLLVCTTGAVAASYVFPMPSFVKSRGNVPAETATCELRVEDLDCRGRGNLFFYFLERDDLFALPGYLKVEAWPDPDRARVRITYQGSSTSELAIKRAITEPYFDLVAGIWRHSPFRVEGYDPLKF